MADSVCSRSPGLSRAGSTGLPEGYASSLSFQLVRALADMQNLDIQTQAGDQILGGVIMTPMYYEHALFMEGSKLSDPAAANPATCKLIVAKLDGPEACLVRVSEEDMLVEADHLPRGMRIIGEVMSCLAVSQYGWTRVPAVALHGRVTLTPEALAAAEALGIPISPSMEGPFEEEVATQLAVFLKGCKYPDTKAFIMRDWGFCVFSPSVEEAVAVFDNTIRQCMTGDATQPQVGSPTRMTVITNAIRRLGTSIMRRSQSEQEAAGTPGATAMPPVVWVSQGGVMPLLSAGGMPLSEPASPMAGNLRTAVGSPPTGGGMQVPDDIRKPPTMREGRRGSNDGRIPAFQTGMRPW